MKEVLNRALRGDREAASALVRALWPVVQARAARGLMRRGACAGRDARQELQDLTQEVFAALFDHQARALRAWDADRGLSLENFVGLVAEHQVASILRSGRRSAYAEEPTSDEEIEHWAREVESPEVEITSRQMLEAILDRLKAQLSPRGMEMFHLILVEERSVDELCAMTGMQANAVYAWKFRLGKMAREVAMELQNASPISEPEGPRRSPGKESVL